MDATLELNELKRQIFGSAKSMERGFTQLTLRMGALRHYYFTHI
jgi:hypothetical protein